MRCDERLFNYVKKGEKEESLVVVVKSKFKLMLAL